MASSTAIVSDYVPTDRVVVTTVNPPVPQTVFKNNTSLTSCPLNIPCPSTLLTDTIRNYFTTIYATEINTITREQSRSDPLLSTLHGPSSATQNQVLRIAQTIQETHTSTIVTFISSVVLQEGVCTTKTTIIDPRPSITTVGQNVTTTNWYLNSTDTTIVKPTVIPVTAETAFLANAADCLTILFASSELAEEATPKSLSDVSSAKESKSASPSEFTA